MHTCRSRGLGKVMFSAMFVAAVTTPFVASGQIVRPHIFDRASPYTAEYKVTHTQRLADGNLIDLESKEVVAFDSEHRHMTAKTGTLVPGGSPLGTRVILIDPVARTTSIWTSPGQRVTINTMPELGAPRGCPASAARGDAVNLARIPGPKPNTEDLGTDTIQGYEAHGRRSTTTIPAGQIGNEAALVRTRETWMAAAPTLQGVVVREISEDPQSGRTIRELVSLDQREPDATLFQPPSGYEITRMTMSQPACSTEAATTPQP